MTPVKFGIVGIGGYGRTHVSAVEELEGEGIARLDAAVVIDPENHPEKLAEFARRRGLDEPLMCVWLILLFYLVLAWSKSHAKFLNLNDGEVLALL